MRGETALTVQALNARWNEWYEDRLQEVHHELHVRMSLAQRAMRERDIELGRANKQIDDLNKTIAALEARIKVLESTL